MKWNDITVKQFYEIKEILSVQDDWTILNLIDCIYKVDCQNLPIKELKKFDISFINEPIPEVKVNKYYTLNGTKYSSNCDITKVTVAQFIDYQNYIKEEEFRLEKLLSVFFMPDGCKDYNTNYDIIKVQEDLLELPIDVAQSIGFFFGKQFKILFILFRYCLQKQVKKLKMDKKKKQELLNNLKKMDLWDLVSSLSFLNTVKSQMKQ
jgi:hypothetical protein